MEAGAFVNLGEVENNDKCVESVCNLQSYSNVAYYIGKLCFAVHCANKESCDYEKYSNAYNLLNSTLTVLDNPVIVNPQLSGTY